MPSRYAGASSVQPSSVFGTGVGYLQLAGHPRERGLLRR